jgi:hypothetical protein
MLIDKTEKKGEEILFTLFHSGINLFFAALLLIVRLRFLLLGFLGLGFGFFCHIRSPVKESAKPKGRKLSLRAMPDLRNKKFTGILMESMS